ncbi:MAG TPA: lysophospholipid acyltransferase family protein [Coleofasciculaceae cyanobacterium]
MVLLSPWKSHPLSDLLRSRPSAPLAKLAIETEANAAAEVQPAPSLDELSSPSDCQPVEPQITAINSRVSSWLTPIAYGLGAVVLPTYFRIQMTGQENLPPEGPVILAPTHRARWDSLLVPYAVGRFVTGRDLRFMVSANEMAGFQGWLIQRLGGFPVNPRRPAIASLRYGVEILQNREMLVIYPEGNIFRDQKLRSLKPGLARMALQAEASKPDLGIKVVPIHLEYSQPFPKWGCKVNIAIGKPLEVQTYRQGSVKQSAQRLTDDLETALRQLGEQPA